jgi:hypothetical protein
MRALGNALLMVLGLYLMAQDNRRHEQAREPRTLH